MFLLYVIVIRSLVVTNLTCNAPRGDLLLKNKLKLKLKLNCPFMYYLPDKEKNIKGYVISLIFT